MAISSARSAANRWRSAKKVWAVLGCRCCRRCEVTRGIGREVPIKWTARFATGASRSNYLLGSRTRDLQRQELGNFKALVSHVEHLTLDAAVLDQRVFA